MKRVSLVYLALEELSFPHKHLVQQTRLRSDGTNKTKTQTFINLHLEWARARPQNHVPLKFQALCNLNLPLKNQSVTKGLGKRQGPASSLRRA